MSIQTLIGAASLVAVGAITPGPNNFAVMAAAARAGMSGAAPAVVGILLGSVALLVLAALGTATALAAEPRLLRMLSAGGCLYLCYLGGSLIASSFARGDPDNRVDARFGPSGLVGLFLFQFVNPKAWMLTVTVASAAHIDPGINATILPLMAIFLVIPAICLALWSSLGAAMMKLLSRQAMKRRFDRAMGAALIMSAVALLGA